MRATVGQGAGYDPETTPPWRRPAAEGAGFWGLVGWTLMLGWVMVSAGLWSGGHPGFESLPKPGQDLGATGLLAAYTMLSTLAVTALAMRRIAFLPLLGAVLATAPSVFLYGWMVRDFGISAPAVQVDEIARAGFAAVAAPFLLLPWLLRRPEDESRPGWVRRTLLARRTPGHLAIGIAIFAVVVLQVVFHAALLLPGAERSRILMEEARAVVLATERASEIQRLGEIGALRLLPLPIAEAGQVATPQGGAAAAAVVDAGVPYPDGLVEALARIAREAPRILHAWDVVGQAQEDRFLVVYDGRGAVGNEGPRAWLMPPEAFIAPRLDAISAFYVLTGLSSATWIAGGLFVAFSHRKRHRPAG